MKKLFLATFITVAAMLPAFSQSTHDFLLSAGADIIKTDIDKVFEKAQLGIEANYFVVRKFSVGAGAEFWTGRRNSFVLGLRWYADDHLFFRFRGLVGANDAAFGLGWSKPLNAQWRFEGIGDFYFNQSALGLRAGFSYVIR